MNNLRHDHRYPCVGIDLMYSPIKDECIEGMGAQIYQAVSHDMSFSGLSFDVVHAVDAGQQILVMVANQFHPQEQLVGEVRWCNALPNGLFRIGVRIVAVHDPIGDTDPIELENIAALGPGVPSGADLRCPSCLDKATFTLIGNQQGNWGNGILPLYECSACSSTRTIPNILEFNRRHYLSELKSARRVFEPATPVTDKPRRLERILYVEDDPDIQTVACMALEMVGGFTVQACSSGHQALERAEAFGPDLFLLDMMMPGLTGMRTLELLHQKAALASTPAVFMTAKIQTHEINSYQRSGVLGVIPKPFDPMALANDLNRIWKSQFGSSEAEPASGG